MLHHLDRLGVDHPLGLGRGGDVQGDEIAVLIDLLEAVGVLDAAGDVPRVLDRQVGVVAPHLHVEVAGEVGDAGADRAQADHAEALAG